MTDEQFVRINDVKFVMFTDSRLVDVGVHQTVSDIKGFDVTSGKRVFFLRCNSQFVEKGVFGNETSHSSHFNLYQDDIDIILSHVVSAVHEEDNDMKHKISDMLFDDFFKSISSILRFFGTHD